MTGNHRIEIPNSNGFTNNLVKTCEHCTEKDAEIERLREENKRVNFMDYTWDNGIGTLKDIQEKEVMHDDVCNHGYRECKECNKPINKPARLQEENKMNQFLRYSGSTWKSLNIHCDRCQGMLYQEILKSGEPIDHFACERQGCTWTDYEVNKTTIREAIQEKEVCGCQARISKDGICQTCGNPIKEKV